MGLPYLFWAAITEYPRLFIIDLEISAPAVRAASSEAFLQCGGSHDMAKHPQGATAAAYQEPAAVMTPLLCP